jgi:hypothetical protein
MGLHTPWASAACRVIRTIFAEETETDEFSKQAVPAAASAL